MGPFRVALADILSNLGVLIASLGSVALPVSPSTLAATEDLPVWPGLLVALALAVASRNATGARWRVVALGIIAFAMFLLPALALPGSLVLGQRLVLPAFGFLLAVAEIVRGLALERRTLVAFAGVTIVVLALLGASYEASFRNPLSFAREAVEASPHSPLAHFCLGQAYQLVGDDARALAEYRSALALGPAEVVHNNVAVIAMKRGKWLEAESELRQELDLNPGYGRAYYNLGIVLRHEGRPEEACAAEDVALERSPQDDRVREERALDCGSRQLRP